MGALGKIFYVNLLVYAHWFMSIIFSQMKDNCISVDQARYATSIVSKYLDNATVKVSTKFFNTNFTSDIIFTKVDAYTSDEQVEKYTKELYINYRSCIGSLVYFLSTRVDLSFALHKFAI